MQRLAGVRLSRGGWLGALLVFGLLGLLESARDIINRRAAGLDFPIWTGLLGNMPWWLIWALLLPVVLALVTRYPVVAPARARSLLVHIVAGSGLSVAHGMANGALYWAVMAPFRAVDIPITRSMIGVTNQYLFMNLLTYGGLVGAAHALAFAARLREREIAAARLEQAVAAARLDALQMELNPHFLFNTLNAISGLVGNGERDTAVRMLARLGDLLRLTLARDGTHMVPLRRELELAGLHLDIEQTRFRDRLTVAIEPDPDTLDLPVPTLLLQPLVENAIRHGIAPHPGPGRVVVRSRRSGEQLVLEVEDSGNGFAADNGIRPGGRGIANVRARLAELYGQNGALDYRVLPGGFVASVTLTPSAAVPIDAELD
jgi:hypothetical protein